MLIKKEADTYSQFNILSDFLLIYSDVIHAINAGADQSESIVHTNIHVHSISIQCHRDHSTFSKISKRYRERVLRALNAH